VIVLDENVFESQGARLRSWRLHFEQIGRDVGRKGMQDDEIITLLRRLRRPSFFTRDRDFFERTLSHDSYCLVYLDVRPLEIAKYVRRVLRHPDFKKWAQRKGCVVRASAHDISVWRPRTSRLTRHRWFDRPGQRGGHKPPEEE
jgi:hypothetical protein